MPNFSLDLSLLSLLSTLSSKYNFPGQQTQSPSADKNAFSSVHLFFLSIAVFQQMQKNILVKATEKRKKTKKTETTEVRRKKKAYDKTLKYNRKLWRVSEPLSIQAKVHKETSQSLSEV